MVRNSQKQKVSLLGGAFCYFNKVASNRRAKNPPYTAKNRITNPGLHNNLRIVFGYLSAY